MGESRVARFGIFGTLVRELITSERSPRIPEPDLVMDDPNKVTAFVQAGREAKVIAPTYLFHCAHISEVIRPGETVVDLACGPATQLGMVARLNPDSRFIGVDLSKEMLGHAQDYIKELGLTNVELRTGDITDLHLFGNDTVDAVVSTLSLHHLPTLEHLESTFSEIARILKPGGGVYLSDFTHLKSEKSMAHFAFQHQEQQSELFTTDYLNSLRAAFYRADFERLTQKYLADWAQVYATFPLPLMMAIKSAPRRSIVPTLQQVFIEMRQALPTPQQSDLRNLSSLFQWGGLRSEGWI